MGSSGSMSEYVEDASESEESSPSIHLRTISFCYDFSCLKKAWQLTDDHLRLCIQTLFLRLDPLAFLVLMPDLFIILDVIDPQGPVEHLGSVEVVDR